MIFIVKMSRKYHALGGVCTDYWVYSITSSLNIKLINLRFTGVEKPVRYNRMNNGSAQYNLLNV